MRRTLLWTPASGTARSDRKWVRMLNRIVGVILIGCAWASAHPADLRESASSAEAGPSQFVFPWGMNTDPTDVPKSHVQEITEGTQKYEVVQGGTMDGRSCRTPMGVGMNSEGAFFQTWESNRSVRMENVGDTDVVNPWLSNGRNNFRNVAEIVESAITPDMTDAEKAFAIWFQEIQYRHHSGGDNNELGDPVKVFNVYGYNTCGNDSICLGTLWQAGRFPQRHPPGLSDTASTQVFYDGAWHFLDGDLHCVYLLRDNETVASDVQLARDHDLVKRTHSNGILLLDTQWDGQGTAALYFTETRDHGTALGQGGHHDGHGAASRGSHRVAVGTTEAAEVPRNALHDAHLPAHDLQRPVGVPAGPEQADVAAGSDEGREHPVGAMRG